MADATTQAGTAGTNPTAEELEHQRMVADGRPLESPEAAQAAFEELAAEVTGDKPPVRETPRPTEQPAGTAGAAPRPTAGPTPAPTTAPTSQPVFSAEEIEALRMLPNALKTMGGRVAKMQGDLEKMAGQAAAATTAAGQAAPSKEQIAAASGDQAKWKKLATDFPEWGEAIEERIAAAGGSAPVDIEAIRKQAREEAQAEARALIEEQREADIAEEHPDWKDKLKSQTFVDWFNAQDAAYRTKLYRSNSARAISGMLTKFDLDVAQQSQQQSSSTAPANPAAISTAPAHDLAAAVTKRGGSSVPRPSESELSGKELWDHLAAKETAK